MMNPRICLFLVITVAYLLLLCLVSLNFPFSLFFGLWHTEDALFHQVQESNVLRMENSNKYFHSLNATSSLDFYKARLKGEHLKFAVGIISIKRMSLGSHGKQQSYGYLLQSAAALDALFKEKPVFNESVPFICNVHSDAAQHSDATRLYSYMPYIERYGKNSLGISDIFIPHSDTPFKDVTRHLSLYQKETYDYVFCLEAAAKLNPDFILLIEEDTIPHADFPDFLDHLINFRLKYKEVDQLGFIKFYYPQKWQGFGLGFVELLDLVSFSILGASLTSILAYFFTTKLTLSSLKRLFTAGFFISLTACYIIGKQNINEFRRLSSYFFRMKNADACCTQAILYPLWVTKELSFFMISESMSTHTDLIIGDFVSEKELQAYQIEPNLFYHTGFYSSLPLEQKHPVEFIIP